MLKKIKYLSLSDIHLGHNNNKTNEIVENLRYYFNVNHKLFKTLDIIFIAGDIYEKLLVNNSAEFILATEWITELLIYCKVNNIRLRILEGTPSHDWKQSKVITTIISKLKIEVDFKYIDTLYIEKMLDLNFTILYVPDEYKHKASETFEEVLDLLKENHLLKVDIAVMHGQFNYQLPMVKLESSHDENNYLSIVKHYISIGHIHTASVFDRIIAQGSFDRLAHNEEEDKGGVVVTILPNDHREFVFIKNTKAKIFKTFKYTNLNLEDLLITLDKEILKLPPTSYVRVIANKDVTISKNIKTVKDRYSNYTIKVESEDKKAISTGENILHIQNQIENFSITKENIETLLLEQIQKHELSPSDINVFKSELNLIINNL